MATKPTITGQRTVAKSLLFQIEQVDLSFANGVQRIFERICGSQHSAVMIVPCLDEHTILLIREYCVGTDRYELGFPKGLLENSETLEQGANRELMEEAGYGAHAIRYLHTLATAPGFLTSRMHVMVATDLYEHRIPGDEPEPMEVIPWSLHEIPQLLARDDFTEARSLAALLLLQQLR